MRLAAWVVCAIVWQSSTVVNLGAPATPRHLRFQRAVLLPSGASGMACATLDASVLAHTASAAHNDLRLYRAYAGTAGEAETPYRLTESGPEAVPDAEAVVEHVASQGGALRFDLRMPARPYSEVQLRLRTHDFVGTVEVTGDLVHGHRENLGTFGIFDLERPGAASLGHWTVLPMAETSLPVLHVTLRLRTPGGVPVRALPPALVEGATVPPSRERQTVYTPVAVTETVAQAGKDSVAVLRVPAHVPVERLRIALSPEFDGDFRREVLVRARPLEDPTADAEVIDAGAVQRVRLPSGDPGLRAIDLTEDALDATLGATLGSAASVRVSVRNGNLAPLPIRKIALEMRERRLCFRAVPETLYTLRYGDPGLAAPVYDDASLPEVPAAPITAQLGPEARNSKWRQRQDERRIFERHPELFWVLVMLCTGMLCGTALHYIQHREGHARR